MSINAMKKYRIEPETSISGNVFLLCFPNHLSITTLRFFRAIPNLRDPLDIYEAQNTSVPL